METGTLFIAGGATTHHFDRMLKALIEAAGGPQHKFALIVSASGDGPDETFREYQKDFTRMGVAPENVVLIPLYEPDVRDERGFNALNGDHPCLPALFEGVRVGFGVSEDTAMVVHEDSVTVLGGAGVYVADCRNAVRTAPGCYDHVLLHAIHEGDSLDLSTGVFTLAGDDSGKSPTYVTPDYVAGGFINSPAFDRFMSVNVLRCREDLMPLDEAHGKRYAQGVDVCDIDGQAHAVVFRYLRDASTRGYRAAHTSFTGIELQTRARTIDL